MERLRSLWPGEPLLERFPAWLASPLARPRLERLLARVFAAELAEALEAEDRSLVRVGSELRVLGRESFRIAGARVAGDRTRPALRAAHQ